MGWDEFVGTWLKGTGESSSFSREPLAGDASNRRYFRVRFDNPSIPPAILMEKSRAEGFKKSEEASSARGDAPPGDPFILIARFLKTHGLPAPALLRAAEDGSMVLQEDFGDDTLFSRLQSFPGEGEALTEKALLLLIRLQGLDPLREMPWIAGRHFGEELIRWEFEHFLEYGIVAPSSAPLVAIRSRIAEESALLAPPGPRVLVHRDYHSRNLMVREGGHLGLIDFQDLLQGAPFYDLASFLFDPYRNIPMEDVEKWCRFYVEEGRKAGVLSSGISWEECFLKTARHAFQRNMKACGRFFYIADVKGNPAFLPSVPGTHRNLARLSEAVPDLRSFYRMIEPCLRDPSVP